MYLDEFRGAVITVSHDRYFLDRTSKRIFAFEKDAHILEHTGNYADYVEFKKKILEQDNLDQKQVEKEKPSTSAKTFVGEKKLKFTYQESKDFETLEELIDTLDTQISEIDEKMSTITTDFVKLNELSVKKDELEETLLEKMERFEYLTDLNDQIQAQKKQ